MRKSIILMSLLSILINANAETMESLKDNYIVNIQKLEVEKKAITEDYIKRVQEIIFKKVYEKKAGKK